MTRAMTLTRPYPFSAIIGQEMLKRVLLLNVVDPAIGGALISGERGTAKSTAVRALPPLLPPIAVVEGCPYRCAPDDPPAACPHCDARAEASEPRQTSEGWVPLVELPVSATEDRVAGSFDLESAIGWGVRRFEPGLLAAANRGILYVDEVNLLPDHLIDAILDSTASGTHRVEREGISVTHPARFVLLGTMNPEEGELRPQLLDRFGLSAGITTPRDPAERAAIVRRRVAFDADPNGFASQWETEEAWVRERIVRARALLPRVQVEDALLDLITRICVAYEVDGLRADIVIYRAAAAAAALEGRDRVAPADVRAAGELALPHRQHRQPFSESGFDRSALDTLVAEAEEHAERSQPPPVGHQGSGGDQDGNRRDPGLDATVAAAQNDPLPGNGGMQVMAGNGADLSSATDSEGVSGTTDGTGDAAARRAADDGLRHQVEEVHLRADPARPAPHTSEAGTQARARRRAGSSESRAGGSYVRAVVPRGRPVEVAFGATVRVAAPHQRSRREASCTGDHASRAGAHAAAGMTSDPANRRLRLVPSDLRERVREGHASRLVLFVVDASGSMGARRRMAIARGAVRSLLVDAYRARDLVGLIAFRGTRAELVLPPTTSVALADRRLAALPTGGRTPLAAALELTAATLARHATTQRRAVAPLVVLISDGRANVGTSGDPWGDALRAARRLSTRHIPALVVDTERAPAGAGLNVALAEALGAQVLVPDAKSPAAVVAARVVARHIFVENERT